MALPGNKNFSDYDNYITDQNPTTSAQAQDYFRNQAELLKAVIDCDFWQPETVYQPGDVVKSDSMPNGTEAVMVATKASVTSNVEPQWGNVGSANISDGACFWKLRWQHWSKDVEQITDLTTGAINRLPNTNYAVGNVVYNRSNLSVALKCTNAGTTSADELDISGNNVGDSVTDGGVVWRIASRMFDDGLIADGFTMSAIGEQGEKDIVVFSNVKDNGAFIETYINEIANANHGARLVLRHRSNPNKAGWFEIDADNGDVKTTLAGSPQGDLFWGGKKITQIYYSPAELGLTGTNIDLVQIFNAMPNGSIFIGSAGNNGVIASNKSNPKTPYYNGVFQIIKQSPSRNFIINGYCTASHSGAGEIAYTHAYATSGTTYDDIADWYVIGTKPTVSLDNIGYVRMQGDLVFAWAWQGQTGDNPVTITKPIPFTTYVASPIDYTTNSTNRYPLSWDRGKTTDTTDTFNRNDGYDAIAVFWVGKAV